MGENTGKYVSKSARARLRVLHIVGTTGLVAVVALPTVGQSKVPDLVAEPAFYQRLNEARTIIESKSVKRDPVVPFNADKQDVAQWGNWGNWGNAWRNY